jgi:hypothetical protein
VTAQGPIGPTSGPDGQSELSGLPTKLAWAGPTATGLEPFPTLLVSISHIVIDATKGDESLVRQLDDMLGTHRNLSRVYVVRKVKVASRTTR